MDSRSQDYRNDAEPRGLRVSLRSETSMQHGELSRSSQTEKNHRIHHYLCRPSIPSIFRHCKKYWRCIYSISPRTFLNPLVLDYPYQHLHAGHSPAVPTVRGRLFAIIARGLWKTPVAPVENLLKTVENFVDKVWKNIPNLLINSRSPQSGSDLPPVCGETEKFSTILSTTLKTVDKSGCSPFKDSSPYEIPDDLSTPSTTPTTTTISTHI